MGRARLSALDGSFLRVETPTAHMHVAWKGIFEPRRGRRVSVAELRAAVGGRLQYAPRFRQRLAFTPGGFAEPVWVDDERFDAAGPRARPVVAACRATARGWLARPRDEGPPRDGRRQVGGGARAPAP